MPAAGLSKTEKLCSRPHKEPALPPQKKHWEQTHRIPTTMNIKQTQPTCNWGLIMNLFENRIQV